MNHHNITQILGRLFPLTPALSLGEREDRRPSVGAICGSHSSGAGRPLFPLVGGEGQGEGDEELRSRRSSLRKLLSFCLLILALQASAQTITNIAYLRTLVDSVNYVPTNTTALFTVAGIVTTHTNITTAANAQFYIQDNTAGITVFVSGSSTIRPSAGDLVRVTGPLGHFNGLLELNLVATNASHNVTILSTNNPLPAATLLQFNWQNDPAIIEPQEGKYVVASNVFVEASTPTFPSGQTLLVTNGSGETFTMFIDARTDIVGQTKPTSAVSIFGVLGQRDTTDPRTTGYQLIPTRYADFVGGAKPPIIRFTNVLENLIRPGDLPINTFIENVLRPAEKLTLRISGTDPEGKVLTISPVTNNLPPSASWMVGQTTGTNLAATFMFQPAPTDAGSNYLVVLDAYNSTATNHSTWSIYVPTPAEQMMIISEFLANPTTDTNSPYFNPLHRDPASTNAAAHDEFIELVNLGSTDLDLVGWTIADDVVVRHTFFNSLSVQSSNAIIVYGGPLNGLLPNLPVASTPLNPSGGTLSVFNNTGDSIILRNANSNLVARVVYGATSSTNGISLTRYPTLNDGFVQHDQISNTNASPGLQYDGKPFSEPPAPGNASPTISDITNQVTQANTPVGPLPFTIGDAETPAASLSLTNNSSNPTLVPPSNIVFGGSGANRTVTITPAPGQQGTATITVIVTDGGGRSASDRFELTVAGTNTVNPGLVLADTFSYADGSLITNSAFVWNAHSGKTGETQVVSGKLQLSGSQTEDINATLTNAPFATNSGVVLYAGFTVNFSQLPSGAGTYFAHFKDTGTSNFRARVFASTTNAASGSFRLGVANASGTASTQVTNELSLNTTYTVVVRYNIGTAVSTLWIGPTSESDSGATATDSASLLAISTFAFRQSTGIGALAVDDLKVGKSFGDVVSVASSLGLQIARSGSNVEISWPTSAAGFVLQGTATLDAPIWSSVAFTQSGDRNVALVPANSGARFYRLLKTGP